MYFSTKQLLGTYNLGSLVSESVLDQSMLSEGLAKTWSLAYFSTLPWLRFDELSFGVHTSIGVEMVAVKLLN